MAAILCDSVDMVIVPTCAQAILLAMKKPQEDQFIGFLGFPTCVWGSAWRPFRAQELRYEKGRT